METSVGVLGILAYLSGSTSLLHLTLRITTCIYILYAGFALLLIHIRPGAPCGCAGSSDQANGWTVARGALLGGLATLSLSGLSNFMPGEIETVLAPALLASGALGVVIWQLPVALGVPNIDGGIRSAGDLA